MKKISQFLCFLSLTVAACSLPACSDSNDDNPAPVPGGGEDVPGIVPTEGVTTEAYYKGDLYDTGTGNLWINFISDMKYDEDAADYVGPGYVLCLDFNTALAENPDFASLAEGSYTCDYTNDSHAAFTLNIAYGDSYLVRYSEAGSSSSFEITGGTVTVAVKEGYYCIDASLTLSDDTPFEYSFIGEISFLNRSEEGQMSNLTGAIALEGMTQGLMAYGGTVFTEMSDLYMVILAGEDYNLDINYGASDALMFSFNVAPGSSTGVPSGNYTVIDAMTADDYDVNTLLSGVYEPAYGGYFGSWYFSTRQKLEASLRGGNVNVTDNGDGTYRFEINLKDGYGHAVTGSCTVPCRVEDWS